MGSAGMAAFRSHLLHELIYAVSATQVTKQEKKKNPASSRGADRIQMQETNYTDHVIDDFIYLYVLSFSVVDHRYFL